MQKFAVTTRVSFHRIAMSLYRHECATRPAACQDPAAPLSRWQALLHHDEGLLTFEWIVLLTLLVIGIIGGIAGIRDALIHEVQGSVGAMVSLDQSYSVAAPLSVCVSSVGSDGSDCATSSASYSSFRDSASWGVGRANVSSIAQPIDPGTLCPIQ